MSDFLEVSRRQALQAFLAGGALTTLRMPTAFGAVEATAGVNESDPFFGEAELDADEWRDAPIRHRYVHGGFKDTQTRFQLWFPEPDHYQGRFAQFLQGGMGGDEHTGEGLRAPQIAFENGAYYVESNQGHIGNDMSGTR